MTKEPRICAICEEALGETDLEAVCLGCYRKARSGRPAVPGGLTEEEKAGLGMAFAVGGFLCAGLQVLYEWSREKEKGRPSATALTDQRGVPLSNLEIKRQIRQALLRDLRRLDPGGPKAC
jgi:hypothetical protein